MVYLHARAWSGVVQAVAGSLAGWFTSTCARSGALGCRESPLSTRFTSTVRGVVCQFRAIALILFGLPPHVRSGAALALTAVRSGRFTSASAEWWAQSQPVTGIRTVYLRVYGVVNMRFAGTFTLNGLPPRVRGVVDVDSGAVSQISGLPPRLRSVPCVVHSFQPGRRFTSAPAECSTASPDIPALRSVYLRACGVFFQSPENPSGKYGLPPCLRSGAALALTAVRSGRLPPRRRSGPELRYATEMSDRFTSAHVRRGRALMLVVADRLRFTSAYVCAEWSLE
jgi:hypothetical protein